MKRALLIIILIFCFVVVMSTSGAVLRGGGGYQVSQVADIRSGVIGSVPKELIEFNGKLYFSASEVIHATELWEYDGIGSPKMTADIRSGVNSSSPSNFAVYKDKLYFSARDDTYGHELWVYDGVNPPSLVMDINSPSPDPIQGKEEGPAGSYPSYLTVYKNKLYFSANDGTSGAELWEYDGINPPSRTRDIYPGSSSSSPSHLTVFNNKLYFSATDGLNGVELWVFDAIVAPSMVNDFNVGPNSSSPKFLTAYNSKLYYQASNGTAGSELVAYDGATSFIHWDIYPGALGSTPMDLAVFNGNLYFSSYEPTNGRELWKTDGNIAYMVANIASGSTSSSPLGMIVFNDNLLFRANNGSAGTELMLYDGSNPPVLVANINSSSASSTPQEFAVFKDKLFFRADDGIDGPELWEYGPQTQQELFYSQAAYDGWVRESGENTNKGGAINTNWLVCYIGDDPFDRQYRTLLHFNTSRIPDNAVVTKVTVQYKQQQIIGSNPYATHGKVWADIKDGFFSNNPGLVKSDFAAAPSKNNAGYFVFTPSSLAYPIYRASIKSNYFQYLNLDGITQFRLRFWKDDDNDNTADYLKIFCGDMPVPFNRPNLRVWYYYDPD